MEKKTKKTIKILVVLAVICVTTIPTNANDGRLNGKPGANPLGSYNAKLEMINKTKNRTYRFYCRWSENETWRALTGPVSPGRSNISKCKIQRKRVTIFLKAECVSGGSGYITTAFVVHANTTNWWGITD